MFNKSTESAIAAMTSLAEIHGDRKLLTAGQIAERRQLQRPFVAKLLTQLAAAGLVVGSPGRHGGYALARNPSKIRLLDIALCFERRITVPCPFGERYCDHGPRCPIHAQVIALGKQIDRFLVSNTLASFTR